MVPVRPSLHNTKGLACILTAALGLLWPWGLFAEELAVKIPDVIPRTGCSVGFSVDYFDRVSEEEFRLLSTRPFQSKYFDVRVDEGSYSRGKNNEFQFYIYVQKIGDPSAERFRVSEWPQGIFTDYLADIPITLMTPSINDTATISGIPIHALYEGPVFSLSGDRKPLPVKLETRPSINIPLVSNLSDLKTTINDVKVESTSCKACWLGKISPSYDSPVQPRGSPSLILSVQPNSLHALFASAFSVNPDTSHDVLAVYIKSTPDLLGLPTDPQRIEVPVRFWPSSPFLALAVILGSLIGFGIRRLLPKSDPTGDAAAAAPAPAPNSRQLPMWSRDLLLSFATAVIVEILGLIMFNPPNTPAIVYGFALDPSQIVPAFLLSILVAGGPRVASRISSAIKI